MFTPYTYYTFKEPHDELVKRLVAIEERNRFEDWELEDNLRDHIFIMEREEAEAIDAWYHARLQDDWLLQHEDPAKDPTSWRN